VCMTPRLDVAPKTTEQKRIVCIGKSEAEVTSNKKLRLRYCTFVLLKLTTDRLETSRGLFATAELLVYIIARLNCRILLNTCCNASCDNSNRAKVVVAVVIVIVVAVKTEIFASKFVVFEV